MAWSNSKIFRQFVADTFTRTNMTNFASLATDVTKVALYNNTGTPSQDVTAANSAYAVDQWVVGNEVTDATNWVAGGRALASQVVDAGTAGIVFFDAADLSGAGNVTLASVFGCLVYDSTVSATASRGVCFNYFGGSQSVTAGTFTIVWSNNGLFRFTL